jgi:hypothetical protein
MRVLVASVLVVAATSGSARADAGLDRATIAETVAKVKAKIIACSDNAQAGGTVRARIEVGADGKVTSATADGSDDKTVNTCVADVVKTLAFKATKVGGSFSYPFVFGAKTRAVAAFDYDTVAAAIERIKAKFVTCDKQSSPNEFLRAERGRLLSTAKVDVGADGKVTKVDVFGGDELFNACIARAYRTMTLPKSEGGTFSYRFSPDGFLVVTEHGDVDLSTVDEGLSKVGESIRACGGLSKGPTTVKAHVQVGPDGKVSSVTTDGTADPRRETCVIGVLKGATFKVTNNGGAFTYPFGFSASSTAEGIEAEAARGEELDLMAVAQAIATVKSKIVACGQRSKAGATVKAYVQVRPNGTVSSASADGGGDTALDKCVAGVLKAAKFQPTKTGGLFTYPFAF